MSAAHTPPPPLSADQALFLDFDGTLVPIQDDPNRVVLPTDGERRLSALATALDGALAAISGRDVRDLSARVPIDIWRAGGHGLEVCAPGEPPAAVPRPSPGTLLADIEDVLRDFPGTWAEPKGPVIAVHYRAAPDARAALQSALRDIVDPIEGYAIQNGKMVLEAKPADAHKGKTLEKLMDQAPFKARQPVMVGDDTTDEDAMASALRAGGLAVKVGPGHSVADYRLDTPEDVWAWLNQSLT